MYDEGYFPIWFPSCFPSSSVNIASSSSHMSLHLFSLSSDPAHLITSVPKRHCCHVVPGHQQSCRLGWLVARPSRCRRTPSHKPLSNVGIKEISNESNKFMLLFHTMAKRRRYTGSRLVPAAPIMHRSITLMPRKRGEYNAST